MKLFEQYQFQPFVKETLQKLNFQSPTEIQKSVIPLVYKHRDVIGISQTGTGKTHAFLIPIMDMIETSADCVQQSLLLLQENWHNRFMIRLKFLQIIIRI